jgi:hypothetical protein
MLFYRQNLRIARPIKKHQRLPINFFMTADIKQDNFMFRDFESQGDAEGVGETDGVKPGKFPS